MGEKMRLISRLRPGKARRRNWLSRVVLGEVALR